jgi:nitrile hydratase accessory protein
MSESSFIETEAAGRATEALPGIPRDANGPVFRAPWEAHAFAMALALYEKGLFTWTEWSAMLGEEIKKAQAAGDPDTGETYYRHWLATLERMVAAKGRPPHKAGKSSLGTRDAQTPHGKPIELSADDFRK